MTDKKRIKLLAELLDDNYYFKPDKDGKVDNKYEIDDDGETLRIIPVNPLRTIYGNESFTPIVIGLGLSSYIHINTYKDNRLEIVIGR